SLLLSKRHRHLLKGVEHSDSLTWDAHKMMFVPSLCTFLLYKDKARSFEVFSQDAPYLLASEDPLEVDCDSARRAIECTKRPLSVAAWALWSIYGESFIASCIDKTIDTARVLHGLIAESGDFMALHEPECNIVCFRYEPSHIRGRPPEELSAYQSEIRKRVLERGDFYITGTRLDGIYALRVTVMNPETGEAELKGLLNHIREIAP
ncbi:MAG TPA: pyridoxal-dependent decarboxylase, partial [Bdellovibrionales bacterium]|nr:pyridoxal-dependent decarboxylase [Bdellovibrionales bacterium]